MSKYLSQLKPVEAHLEVLVQAVHMGKRSPQETRTKLVAGVEEEFQVGESLAFLRCGAYTVQARRALDRKGDVAASFVTVTDGPPEYAKPAEGNQFGARKDNFVGYISFPGDTDGHQAVQFAEDLADEIDQLELQALMGHGRTEAEIEEDEEADGLEARWDELMGATE